MQYDACCKQDHDQLRTYGPIGTFDLCGATNTSELLSDQSTFNADISRYGVSTVTTVAGMLVGGIFVQPADQQLGCEKRVQYVYGGFIVQPACRPLEWQ